MDKGNPRLEKKILEAPKEFVCEVLLTASVRRKRRLSRLWMRSSNPKICWWFQTVSFSLTSSLTWHRLRDLGKSTYLCFLPAPHQGFLLKHSHMLRLRRGLERGGEHSDERAIHREISGKGSEGEREKRRKQGCVHECVCVSMCEWSVCVCGEREKNIQPQHHGV